MDQLIRVKLVVGSAARALEWYAATLGAAVGERHDADGRVVFAELRALGTTLTLKDADAHDPATEGLVLDVVIDDPDGPDALWTAMVDAGAVVVFPLEDQPYGRRAGRVRDPFGVQWILSGPPRG